MGSKFSDLLPAMELLSRSREISEEALDEVGRIIVESLLGASAIEVAGEPRRGKEKGEVRHYGLQEIVCRPISKQQLAVFMDGVGFGNSVAVCSIGVDEDGVKTVLGLAEGATENASTVGAMLDSMIERGLDPKAPVLFVIDGSKA